MGIQSRVLSNGRSYELHVPNNWVAGGRLVVACHGGGSTGLAFSKKFGDLSNRGIIIAFPTALTRPPPVMEPAAPTARRWLGWLDANPHEDELFIAEVANSLVAEFNIGTDRALVGFSSGGWLAHHNFWTAPETFSHYGPTSSCVGTEQLSHIVPLPAGKHILFCQGTLDPKFVGAEHKLGWKETRVKILERYDSPILTGTKRYAGTKTKTAVQSFSNPLVKIAKVVGADHHWPHPDDGDYDHGKLLLEQWGWLK